MSRGRAVRRLAALAIAALAPAVRAQDARRPAEIPVADPGRDGPVDFAVDVAPAFRSSCLACHNDRDPEGDLSLESPGSIRKGGASGPAIVPGDAEKSRLLRVAAHRAGPSMPPRDNKVGARPLTPDQLGLLRLWIDQGAHDPAPARPAPAAWRPAPASYRPIFALAVSPDARYAACGRADRVVVYDLDASREVARLVDPALPDPGGPGRADVDSVRALAFSPDGGLLASGGFRTIKLWRRPRMAPESDFYGGTAFAIHPAGALAAFSRPDGAIAIRELPSGRLVREIPADGEAPPERRALAFSADGMRLYLTSAKGDLDVWDVEGGIRSMVIAMPSPARALAALPRGGRIVTGHEDGRLLTWDLARSPADREPIAAIPAHSGPVTGLATWPAGPDEVVSSGEDGWIRRWDVVGSGRIREFRHGSPAVAVAASPDGSRFASVGGPVARLWDATGGGLVAELGGDPKARGRLREAEGAARFATLERDFLRRDLKEAASRVEALTKAHDAARKLLEPAEKALAERREAARKPRADLDAATEAAKAAAAGRDRAAAARKAAEAALAPARDAVGPAREAARSARDVAAKEPGAAGLAEAAEKSAADAAEAALAAEAAARAAALAAPEAEKKAREAASAERQAREALRSAEQKIKEAEIAREVALFSIETSRQVLERDRALIPAARSAVASAESAVAEADRARQAAEAGAKAPGTPWRSVAFAARGTRLVAGDDAGSVRGFDAERGSPAESCEIGGGGILGLSGGPGGEVLAVSASGRATSLRDDADWTLARTIGRVDDPATIADRVLGLDFHPDGGTIASAGGAPGRPGELKIWGVADGRLVRESPGIHGDAIFGARFSPDGRRIATASADRSAKIVPTAGDGPTLTLSGHAQQARGIAWRADGKVVATSGADGLVKFWDPDLGTLLRTETGDVNRTRDYRREVTSIRFVGPGDLALAASGDGTVRVHRGGDANSTRFYAARGPFAHVAVASADGKWILAGGHDGVLRLWDGDDARLLREFPP